jgi:putative drug exporter of the RND superfamily
VLRRIALLAIAAPRWVVAAAVLVTVAAGIFGIPVAGMLSSSGFEDPASESARATHLLTDKFHRGDLQMMITVTAPDSAESPAARAVGLSVVDQLRRAPNVAGMRSAWTVSPAEAKGLVSRDGRTALIVAELSGGDSVAQTTAHTLSDAVSRAHPVAASDIIVRPGGAATVNAQINSQLEHDLLLMESIAIPLSFLVLIWVFGGLLAAALPVAVGLMAILGSMAVLRFIALGTDVSNLAPNLSTAMGLALAIDYTLLIVSRYRDELADGADPDTAIITTMTTAGRTVLISATTVALSMAAMILFPMHVLKSFAYAGVATVAFAAVAAVVVTPAAIVLLGDRLNSLDVRRSVRRLLRRPDPVAVPIEARFWYRSTTFVMRHALPLGLAVVALLLALGAPFLGVKWGFPDERVLPVSASAHQVGDQLRHEFADNSANAVTVVIPDADGLTSVDLSGYAAELSRVSGVSAVSAPTGTFVGGARAGSPSAATGAAQGSAFLTVDSTAPLFSDSSQRQLDALHAVPGPGGRAVELTGTAQTNRDSVEGITSRLPGVLGLIAVITFGLLFLLTGSVVLPLKALVLNMLSLTAAFGALVWIFQDGHLAALGTTATGTLVANIPVLLFCIAFGLSMDYEVFLLARIREYWLNSRRTRADNDESVALGLARTGRVITAAALVMSISFAGLFGGHVQFMRMLGLGLTLAVLMDATLVRMVLLPASMHVLGRWNWWAPRPLVWLHNRIGLSENANDEPAPATAVPRVTLRRSGFDHAER